MNIQRFVAVAYYSKLNSIDLYYVLYDFIDKQVKVLSSDGVELVINQIVNLDTGEIGFNHLTPIWKVNAILSKNISVKSYNQTCIDREVTFIDLYNAMYREMKWSNREVVINNIVDNGIVTYNTVVQLCIQPREFGYRIIIVDNIEKSSASFINDNLVFIRNSIKCNADNATNKKVESLSKKNNLLCGENIEIKYINTNNKITLLSYSKLDNVDKDKDIVIKIPSFVDIISYDLMVKIKNICSNSKSIKIVMNKKQYRSMLFYYLNIDDIGKESSEFCEELVNYCIYFKNVIIKDK